MKAINILEQQTLFDISLQELGSAEGVFDLLMANSTLKLDSELASGQEVIINSSILNASLVDTYTRSSIKPGNGIGALIQVLGTGDGKAILTNSGKYIKIKIKR